MPIDSAFTLAGADTGGGNQDIVLGMGGFGVPTAAAIIAGLYDSANSSISVGFTDGTRQGCVAAFSQGGAGTTNTKKGHQDSRLVLLDGPSGSNGEASFVSFVPDGIRINWNTTPAFAYTLTVVLFNGADLQVHMVNLDLATTGLHSVTAGFEPQLVLTAMTNSFNTQAGNFIHSIGACRNFGGAVTQHCYSRTSPNGEAAGSNTAGVYLNNRAGATILASTLAMFAQAELKNFDSSGYDVDALLNGGAAMIALALRSDDPLFEPFLTEWVPPGNSGVSALDFGGRPVFWWTQATGLDKNNDGTIQTNGEGASNAFHTHDPDRGLAAKRYLEEDGSDPTDCEATGSSNAVESWRDDGSKITSGGSENVVDSGVEYNWTLVENPAVRRHFSYGFVEVPPPAAGWDLAATGGWLNPPQ